MRRCRRSQCTVAFEPRTKLHVYCSLDCFYEERRKIRVVKRSIRTVRGEPASDLLASTK